MSLPNDIRAAVALLTAFPFASDTAPDAPTVATAAWFPWVGVFYGLTAGVPLAFAHVASVRLGDGEFLSRAAMPLAFLVVLWWAVGSRMLHWDGLADVADALWGGHTPQRRLEIMADSRIGAFAAVAVSLVAVGTVGAVATVLGYADSYLLMMAVPVFSRTAATFAAWLGTPARPGGLGSLVIGRPRTEDVVTAAIGVSPGVAVAGLVMGPVGLVWAGSSLLLAAAIPHLLSKGVGGVTGDVMGASVVLCEACTLTLAALMLCWG